MSTTTPFWREAMSDDERAQRVADLFAMLDRQLGARPGGGAPPRTFVFAPDPPPIAFEARSEGKSVRRISWGVAGRAATVPSIAAATALAPTMFDLWSDTLYVLAFDAKSPDDQTLSRWVTAALGAEMKSRETHPTCSAAPPRHAIVIFDWGDLVE